MRTTGAAADALHFNRSSPHRALAGRATGVGDPRDVGEATVSSRATSSPKWDQWIRGQLERCVASTTRQWARSSRQQNGPAHYRLSSFYVIVGQALGQRDAGPHLHPAASRRGSLFTAREFSYPVCCRPTTRRIAPARLHAADRWLQISGATSLPASGWCARSSDATVHALTASPR